ncbi:MFS transporter [Isoptericola sp. NEAU-Y5]|uniref:MFS transporter n=1 Tax=Isoptericola luteus TaxID=2879484 RepID=A0ABS7ZIZ9_9MICO|nr:MFS transporter [Isoptericola sp. NEAU-Y5]MCA5895005.1 MFS transporter [Isoptericola sp. NEAU-Y5]
MTDTPTRAPRTPAPEPSWLGPYGALPRLAGGWFLPIAFAARLPFSMLTIGTLLLVTDATGSVASGSLAGAAAALGTALGGPAQGSLADRRGQRVVLLVCTPIATLALVAMVAASTSGATPSTGPVLLAAALAGASVPQVGPLARVRWIGLTEGRPRTMSAAMSYESTADEVGFVLGPALVGILATTASPGAAMLLAAALLAAGGTAFALHPTARAAAQVGEAHATTAGGTTPAAVAGGAGLLALARAEAVPLAGMLAMGVLFGATQTATTAFTSSIGQPGLGGLLYAVMGVGSAATALAVVALPAGWSQPARWVGFATGLTVCFAVLVPLAATGSLAAVTPGLAVAGLFVGPVMVTVFTVASERAPAARTAAAMTLVASANVVGVAIGAAVTGQVSALGVPAAFAVPALAAGTLLVVGVLLRRGGTGHVRGLGTQRRAPAPLP